MQLCMLYNFGSSTALLQGGRQGRLEPTSLENRIFVLSDVFFDFSTIEGALCPLWKPITPMQLCTLYNFGDSTALLQGGLQGRLGAKPPKIHSFHHA